MTLSCPLCQHKDIETVGTYIYFATAVAASLDERTIFVGMKCKDCGFIFFTKKGANEEVIQYLNRRRKG